MSVGFHLIGQLQTRIRFLLNPIHIHHTGLYFQRVTGDGDTAFDIVVFLVHGADDHGAIMAKDIIAAGIPHIGVIIGHGIFFQHRIPMRKPEHHIIAPFHIPEALEPAVFVLDGGRIRLLSKNDVVGKRDGQRGLRHPRAIGKLADEEMVARVKGTLHRRGRNLEGLEKEHVDERDHHECKDDGIDPIEQRIVFFTLFVLFLPEQPLYLFGNVEVEDDNESKEPPVVPEPDHP